MTRTIETSHTNGPDLPPVVELSVGEALRQVAAEVPHRLALVEGIAKDRRRWTYAELLRDAEE